MEDLALEFVFAWYVFWPCFRFHQSAYARYHHFCANDFFRHVYSLWSLGLNLLCSVVLAEIAYAGQQMLKGNLPDFFAFEPFAFSDISIELDFVNNLVCVADTLEIFDYLRA